MISTVSEVDGLTTGYSIRLEFAENNPVSAEKKYFK
jgi:hypothetical protein